MVKIYVNGLEWADEDKLIETLVGGKQVVKTIEIDGQEYSGSLEMALHEKGARQIKIEAAPLAELLEETMASIKEYLPIVKNSMCRVGRLFQSGQEGEAHSLVVRIIDGLEWLMEAIANINHLVPGFWPEDRISIFRDKLRGLLEALESNDYILAGDLFEYELVPILDRWEAALSGKQAGVN